MDLAVFKQRFDPLLKDVLSQELESFSAHLADKDLSAMAKHVELLAMSGGKRIRPYLAFLLATALGAKLSEEDVLHAVLSLELFHLFALIHDDVMDGGVERHMKPTVHVFAEKILHDRSVKGNLSKIGEGQAILLGDLVLTFAHTIFLDSTLPAHRVLEARRIFDLMNREVIAGQMIDLDLTSRQETSQELIFNRNLLKTASYTFIRPMQFGAALAGGTADTMKFCEDFGNPLGQAFQLQDDLLDVQGGAGKTAMRDLREGQHTLLTHFIREQGTPEQKKLLDQYSGTAFSSDDEVIIRSLLLDSGAIASATTEITKQLQEAKKALSSAPAAQAELGALVEMIEARTN